MTDHSQTIVNVEPETLAPSMMQQKIAKLR